MPNVKKLAVAGLLGGLFHVVIVGGLYVHFLGWPSYSFASVYATLGTIYVYGGALLPGAVPAVLYVQKQLVIPGVTVGAIAIAALLSSPTGSKSAQLAGASDFAFYFIFWFVPLAIAIIIGGAEYLLRHRIGGGGQSEPGAYS